MKSGDELYAEPWCPTLSTSTFRSTPSLRKRRSAEAPASPVKSIRNERYCKIKATELSLIVFLPSMNGNDGPMNVSITSSFVCQRRRPHAVARPAHDPTPPYRDNHGMHDRRRFACYRRFPQRQSPAKQAGNPQRDLIKSCTHTTPSAASWTRCNGDAMSARARNVPAAPIPSATV